MINAINRNSTITLIAMYHIIDTISNIDLLPSKIICSQMTLSSCQV
jgi:hypothetical protein